MIRINLLGHEAEAKGKARSFLPAELSPNVSQIGIGALFVFLIVALGLTWWMQSSRSAAVRADIAAIQAEQRRLQEIAGQVESLQDRTDLMRQKLQVIVDLKASQTGPVMLLDQISANLSDGLWLTRLELNGGSVSLRGGALSEVAVADFVNNLERSLYFSAVRLRTLGDTGEAQNFQITLDFNPSPGVDEAETPGPQVREGG